MNRRGFFGKLGLLAAGFSVLPAATTYARSNWKVSRAGLWRPNPDWVDAPYEMYFYECKYAMIPNPAVIPILFKRKVEESGSGFVPHPGPDQSWGSREIKFLPEHPLPAFVGKRLPGYPVRLRKELGAATLVPVPFGAGL
jgi:hypothetical protein